MPIREVKIYTCDGCRATATLDWSDRARGWHNVALTDKTFLLCTVCYGAVEWVVKFQGITVPPKAHKGPDGRYSLRKQTLDDFPHGHPELDEDEELDFEEDEED